MNKDMYGWLVTNHLNIECLGECLKLSGIVQYQCLMSKFPEDQVFLTEEDQISFLDGYVYNKNEFMEEYRETKWENAFARAMENEGACLKKLRGAFCGYIYRMHNKEIHAFTDHTSNRALYYYADGIRWILSNRVEFMVKVLKENHIIYDFNYLAAQYMLTYGYMLDDSTFVKQIHRILPGEYVRIINGHAEVKRYHLIQNNETWVSEKEAIEKIDIAFRNAIKREFSKDDEYGYQHLVDLSGGLDSRMVSWVAHDLGFDKQVNITYSRTGYQDERISKEIAKKLNHEYLFKALDDAQWMYDIDEITSLNNGSALCIGITGGSRFLDILNNDKFGIEHTGMIGDAILSTFYQNEQFNYSRPRLGLHRYSERLQYEFGNEMLKEYSCQEMFAIYTRGILGAQSSYMIRQNYVETSSPFMDVDFLDTVLSLPFEYRTRHRIYLKWMLERYPESTEFGWEKWGGIKPKESHILFRKIKTTERLIRQKICEIFGLNNVDSMTPVDLWYKQNYDIQTFFEKYYNEVLESSTINFELKNDLSIMFHKGNVFEKSMALTVLAMFKKYFL